MTDLTPINAVRIRPIPTLLQFGRDLTRESREGKLFQVVFRDAETHLLLETLCRRTKRNPILVGPAGVGKTAVVEGFAMMVANGNVPDFMKDVTVVLLQPSLILAAGRGQQGSLEKWMTAIIAEASQDGVILFIDEVHTIVGAGGSSGTADIASIMKPPLARGDLACIAATTDDEYRRFIEPDSALERRFQPIRVQEMSPSQTLQVLKVVRNELSSSRGISVSDAVLDRLIDHANTYMRNRTFPDKAVDLLEQCIASALANGATTVQSKDADAVFCRITGAPLNLDTRLENLENILTGRGVLCEDDVHSLLSRLHVTMRGLDIRTIRPNAVLLLADAVASEVFSVAEIISEALFDTKDRLVSFDLGRISTPEECTMLFGAPPGYVGYSDSAPIHAIKQSPSCVVVLGNADRCHPHVLQLLGQAFREGFFLDGQARKVFLSDAIILLTAEGVTCRCNHSIGFGTNDHEISHDSCRQSAVQKLGNDLLNTVDIICSSQAQESPLASDWLRTGILSELKERYHKLNLLVNWDDSIVKWLASELHNHQDERILERLVDERITPIVLMYQNTSSNEPISVNITYIEEVLVNKIDE